MGKFCYFSFAYVMCSNVMCLLCICSALFGNLRNFEIALRILSIAKLRANFEIAYAISKLCNETTAQFRNGDVSSKIRQRWIAAITPLHLLNTWLGEKGR